MPIALISDIHGYLLPLQAVLADIKQKKVDQMVCLGDVCVLGPQPTEVLTVLKRLNCPSVMGNHDFDLLHPELAPHAFPWIAKVTAFSHRSKFRLTPRPRSFVFTVHPNQTESCSYPPRQRLN